MTNNDQFKDWINQIETEDASVIDELIERKVKKLNRKKQLRRITFPLSTIVSLILAFALLVNFNTSFYVYAISNPLLKPLTQLVNGRQDILSAFDSGYVQLIDKEITVGDYTLEIDSIISDTRSINMFYKVRYQGHLIEMVNEGESCDLAILSVDGESLSYGISYRTFENYWWAEISLKDLNNYKPFIVKYTPNHDMANQFGELQITVDQSKVIQPVVLPIHRTIVVGDQNLILKSLEMGAFSSQLTYYLDPNNEKLLTLVFFKESTGGVSWDDESIAINNKYENFPFGQLNHQNTYSLELKSASILDKAFETISFDPKTRSFNALPPHLTLKNIVVDGNKYELFLEEHQSVGNQGLMPVPDEHIYDVYGISDYSYSNNLQTHHISFFLNSQEIVLFKVSGGTELTELPKPVVIQIN